MILDDFLKNKNIKQIILSNSIKKDNYKILENIDYEDYQYKNNSDNTLFFGMYDINDYNNLNNHKGNKWIFWYDQDINVSNLLILKIKELIKNNNIKDHLYNNDLMKNTLIKFLKLTLSCYLKCLPQDLQCRLKNFLKT